MLSKETIDYVEGIDVPKFDPRAVQARRAEPVRPAFPRSAIAAAAVLVVVFTLSAPAVLAQVERTLRAFVNAGGRTEAVPVASVTLEEARTRVPFTVIAPTAIPPGYQGTLDEIDPGPSRFQSRLIFRFSNGNAPGFTIMESSATQSDAKQRLWMTLADGNASRALHPPALPSDSTGRHLFVQFHNKSISRRIAVEPMSWTAGGTRIDLVSPPGVLSKAQMEAIRRAMY
ncbi:MAG TPA: hypothetical protein VFE36_04630 [Candidatus Baltobacteraceae bacterium]|jgi:hypothetical protein|nr:hypothetical protein [Candidatus Baltobacteraceae bacterium]